MKRIQVVMPKTEIPEWFDCVRNEDIPFFWARRKFPVVALALMFGEFKEDKTQLVPVKGKPDRSYTICLRLFIGGQEIRSKDYHYCKVGTDHVLLCGLRVLFNDEEWQGLDECLGDDWKAVQVQFESRLVLRRWGVYVYDQETDRNHIRFWLQHPNSSGEYMPSSHLVPKRTRQMFVQEIRYAVANTNAGEIFDNDMPLIELGEVPHLPKALMRSWRNAKADIRGEALPSVYGASIKEESEWDVVGLLNLAKEDVPEHIDDSVPDGIQSNLEFFDQILQEQVDYIKENWGMWFDIDMPIILEECYFDKAPTRRYWGNLEINHGEPTFKAVMMTKLRNQLACGEEINLLNETFPGRANIVLLKCQRPSTEEASSSSHGEEYNDPELEALLRRIEEDAMSLNKSYGKMKASIVLMDDPISDEYQLEAAIIKGQQICGMLGSNFKKTPYGRLRAEDNSSRLCWTCYNCMWCTCWTCICCPCRLVGIIVSCISWCCEHGKI